MAVPVLHCRLQTMSVRTRFGDVCYKDGRMPCSAALDATQLVNREVMKSTRSQDL